MFSACMVFVLYLPLIVVNYLNGICVSFSWNERYCVNSSSDFFCYNNVINKSSYNRVMYPVFCLKEGFSVRLVYSVLINGTCATRIAAPLKKTNDTVIPKNNNYFAF